MRRSVEGRLQIRPDKFFPPQIDTPQFLYRQRVLSPLCSQTGSRPRIITVEAQAGQGKTTVVKQFLDQLKLPSVWYQIGPEDADPALFLNAVHACINTYLPAFLTSETAQVLEGGDFSIFDLHKWVDLFLKDLRSCLRTDLFLVFDDLHYLSHHPASLKALQYLLELAPPQLHFILSSREPVLLDNWQLICANRDLQQVGNSDLALDECEIADYFHQVCQLDIPHDRLKKIATATDGWMMGVLLLGLQLERQDDSSSLPLFDGQCGSGPQRLLQYFRQEIFATLDSRLHHSLLILALLDEIPVELAVETTGDAGIGNDLAELARRNIFIRQLNPDNKSFALHHLFQQFLQEKAQTDLSSEVIRETYLRGGAFCRRNGNPAQALSYLLRAEDYAAVEAVLEESGMSFLAANRTATLSVLLQQVPEPVLHQQGWSCFFLGLAYLDSTPAQAQPLLQTALEIFTARQDQVGELLSLTHIISIHIITTGHYREGEELLVRAEELFFQVDEDLDVATTILTARSLAMGYCIFLADIDRSTKFASLALSLARQEKLINFEAALLMLMGYIQIFANRTAPAQMYMEQAAPYAYRREVGTFNCLSIRMMLFNFLFHQGDFANYFDQKNQLIEAIGQQLVSQSIAGPFCYVWEMDIAINRGRFEQALNLSEQALFQHPPFSPHLRSQILQLKSVVLVEQGQTEQALAVAEESQQLRELSGGLYFTTLNALLVGYVFACCGHPAAGLERLATGIHSARQMPSEYLEACGLLHRAVVYLNSGETTLAANDIETGLGLMRRNHYRHFWAWSPSAIQKVLAFAVEQRIEAGYARDLAAERLNIALLDDGRAIPLLHIQTLGGFRIMLGDTTLLQAEDLTPLQRELLCLLLVAPDLKVPQETIQLHFWPDSPPQAIKVKFDTLLSRVRKTLAEVLPENTVQHYLQRGKGIVWLDCCRVDALEFLSAVERGQRHLRLQEFWQAGNAFTSAEPLWQGEFAPGIAGEHQIRSFREKLSRALTEMTFSWCELLMRTNRLQQAILVAEKALSNDPLNDCLYALLYRLQGQNSSVLARQVLKRFATVLQGEGYPSAEIDELVAGLSIEQPLTS